MKFLLIVSSLFLGAGLFAQSQAQGAGQSQAAQKQEAGQSILSQSHDEPPAEMGGKDVTCQCKCNP